MQEFGGWFGKFTSLIQNNFPETCETNKEGKAELLELFPEFKEDEERQNTTKKKEEAIELVKLTLNGSLKEEVKQEINPFTINETSPEECIAAINALEKEIGKSRRYVLLCAARQGHLVCVFKEVTSHSFAHLLRNNIDLSRSHAFFLMRFYNLTDQYKKLIRCNLPLNITIP